MKVTNLNRPGVHAEGIVRGRNGRRAGSSGPNVSDVNGNEVDLAAFIQFDGATVTEIDADTALVTISSGSATGSTVSVTDPAYGAVGDGLTDDTTAIQDAIDAVCALDGGIVYFPPGTYLISATLTVTCEAVWLVGDGGGAPGASIILAAAGLAAGNMLEITAQDCGVRDLEFTSTSVKSGGVGILVNGTSRTVIERVFLHHQYDSIKLASSTAIRVNDCNLYHQARHGIWIDGATGNDFYVSGIVADNSPVSAGYGINITGGGALFAQHSDFLNFSYGLVIAPTAGRVSEWNFLTTCAFDQSTNDGIVIGGGGGDVHGVVFTNCWSASNGLLGLNIGGGAGDLEGIQFNDGQIVANGRHGVQVASPAQRVTLANNLIASNSASSSGTYHGIAISAGVLHIAITGNHSWNGMDAGSTQGYGLTFASGATDYLVVSDNDFSGNVTGTIENLAGVTGTHRWLGGQASDTGWSATTFWRGDGTWAAPSGLTPMTVYEPTIGNWLPLVDGDGNQIMAEA